MQGLVERGITPLGDKRITSYFFETAGGVLTEVRFAFLEETCYAYGAKMNWLREELGLRRAHTDVNRMIGQSMINDERARREAAKSCSHILVYENEDIPGDKRGAWRVDNGHTRNGESFFLFRYWMRGLPSVLGYDTMAQPLKDFSEAFMPQKVSISSVAGLDVLIDFDKYIATSPYPVMDIKRNLPYKAESCKSTHYSIFELVGNTADRITS